MKKLQMVIEELKGTLGNKYRIEEVRVRKNNGVQRVGLVIKDENTNIAPNFYINPDDERTAKEIADEIIMVHAEEAKMMEVNTTEITSKEYILQNVVYKIVNTEDNEEMLQNAPHKAFLDMSLLYSVIVQETEETLGTYLLSNDMLEIRGITKEELEQAAKTNTRITNPVLYLPLGEHIKCTLCGATPTSGNIEDCDFDNPECLVILTNERKIGGAVLITFDDILAQCAERAGTDLVILPSSIHEVLIMKRSKDTNINILRDMVNDVNATAVEKEDFLSNNVYLYKKDSGMLEIA